MSLFLGKIHYWLYNKIILAEQIEVDIINWATTKEIPADKWRQEAIDKYGEPLENKPLEEIIDTSNIHGWLQSKIESVELRQAYLITKIIETNTNLENNIIEVFQKQAIKSATESSESINTPEEAFNALNNFILEGMPCDRVNQVIESDDNKFVWQTTECLHKPYWDQVKGDIAIFYRLRDAWVKAFIESLTPSFKYIKSEDATHQIIKN